ncbi:MAG: TrkA family potassium uptake protein [Oscillospiraceae bacterium]|jgi:trk system potassium uptake protein TrkA|nr:TrkA family potassium uptake protein [Oscillospiraceae bacterium]
MKSVLILGAGNFGAMLARQMNTQGYEIMIVDVRENLINAVMPYVTDAQIGDCTNPTFLKSLGVDNYDLCVVSMCENFQTSLETTSLLKDLGAKQVISRAKNEIQEKFLLRNGADEVVYPEKQVAVRLATKYASEQILDFLQFDGGYSIYEIMVPELWHGKTLPELDVRRKYDINIISLRRDTQVSIPRPNDPFQAGDVVYVVGEMKNVQRCFHIK